MKKSSPASIREEERAAGSKATSPVSDPAAEMAVVVVDDPASLHTPVLLQECLDLLAPAFAVDQPVMVDATLGLGGHTEAALERFPTLTVIGIDRDPEALRLASDRLARFGDRFRPFLGTYDQIDLATQGKRVDGILMDLGVSSMQLDEVDRGFSYSQDAPLDMRMDREEGISAQELLNTASVAELTKILREGADEKFAHKIARAIVTRREVEPLRTTGELAELVRESIPAPARRSGGHPAKRTFQAIRIAVNNELEILEEALPRALESLSVGGRIVIMSYQSLEDRLVKRIFNEGAAQVGDAIPAGVPLQADQIEQGARLKHLTRGAMKASETEIASNPRSQPVRLRAAELLAPWGKQ